VKREGFLSLYKGLGAVITGIVPKMAIRFSSFEFYKGLLSGNSDANSSLVNFIGILTNFIFILYLMVYFEQKYSICFILSFLFLLDL
jgi:hypothetical protein